MEKRRAIMISALAVCLMIVGCGSNENKAVVPFGNYEMPKEDYRELMTELQEAGFENITTETTTTTLDSEVGKVTKLTIDGKGLFTKMTAYEKDVPVVITYRVLQDKTTSTEEMTEEAAGVEEMTEEETVTMGDVYLMITNAMALTYGKNYKAEYDESGITVNLWEDGVAAMSVMARNGDQEAQAEWDNLVEGIKEMTTATKEQTMNKYGYGDKMFVVNVLNDAKKEATLLTVADGVVFYDAVNGIDLMGLE